VLLLEKKYCSIKWWCLVSDCCRDAWPCWCWLGFSMFWVCFAANQRENGSDWFGGWSDRCRGA